MDQLNDEERILAWKSSWHPSFDGVAIVNKDFTFRAVNPQFCKLLGVTPAALIGQSFRDITPAGVKELDSKNSQLLIDGIIDFYILPKKYQFPDGKEIDVILLVTRAPLAQEGEFQFFISRIMLDEQGELLSSCEDESSGSKQNYQKSMSGVVDFAMKYGKWFVALGSIIGAILVALFGKI